MPPTTANPPFAGPLRMEAADVLTRLAAMGADVRDLSADSRAVAPGIGSESSELASAKRALEAKAANDKRLAGILDESRLPDHLFSWRGIKRIILG